MPPVARTARELQRIADARYKEHELLIRNQGPTARNAMRAAISARLAVRGVTIAKAYAAHYAKLAGRSYDRNAAAAWHAAITQAAGILRTRYQTPSKSTLSHLFTPHQKIEMYSGDPIL